MPLASAVWSARTSRSAIPSLLPCSRLLIPCSPISFGQDIVRTHESAKASSVAAHVRMQVASTLSERPADLVVAGVARNADNRPRIFAGSKLVVSERGADGRAAATN